MTKLFSRPAEERKEAELYRKRSSVVVDYMVAPREALERIGWRWRDLASEADLQNWQRGRHLHWDLHELALPPDHALIYRVTGTEDVRLSRQAW